MFNRLEGVANMVKKLGLLSKLSSKGNEEKELFLEINRECIDS